MALSKKNLTIVIVLAVIALVAALKFFQANNAADVDPVEGRSKGNPKAPLRIVEYIDFECPACAYGAEKLKEYMAKHPDTIRVEVKYYPLLNMHPHAVQAASYVECVARQGKFWPFFEQIMPTQAQWSRLNNIEGVFDQMAEGSGVAMGKLKSCLASEDVSVTIMAEKSAGRSMGVQSTPTYFVNDKMLVGSKSLEEELDAYFAKK